MAFGLLCGVDFGRGMSGEADGAVPGMQQVVLGVLGIYQLVAMNTESTVGRAS